MSVIGSSILAGASGSAGGDPLYVDDVFSTFLYEGNGSTQSINNGIDLAGEGGLVWFKKRNAATYGGLWDTERGVTKRLRPDNSDAESTASNLVTSFNSNGVSISATGGTQINNNNDDYVAWTFRKAPGFFDVVTYTGTGSTRTVAHNLGSVPGMIIIKNLDDSNPWWAVYHHSLGDQILYLNATTAAGSAGSMWGSTTPTSTVFTVGTPTNVNASGDNYVAYVFAHDDAQYGTDGDESIIKCGSYTGNSSGAGPEINLGWEPQWVMIKKTNGTGSINENWIMYDNMRGVVTGTTDTNGDDKALSANLSTQEDTGKNYQADLINFTQTGFKLNTLGYDTTDSGNHIYMAIRRPHKPPEAATEVFDDVAYTGTGSANTVSFSPAFADLIWIKNRVYGYPHVLVDRLRGNTKYSSSNSNAIEATLATADSVLLDRQESFKIPGPGYSGGQTNNGNAGYNSYISWVFKRAPGFFDVVAYTGTGSATTINHNLGAVPSVVLIKGRNTTYSWYWQHYALGANTFLQLNETGAAAGNGNLFNNTLPTSSVFSLGSLAGANGSGNTYIAYLFADLPGISKAGTYTGTGNAINVDCGFTNGARFVLIKRTDGTGNWFVLDTARGIVPGNDPLLELNTTSAEDSSYDNLDPYNQGFTVTAYGGTSPYLNISGATYIFLAIA